MNHELLDKATELVLDIYSLEDLQSLAYDVIYSRLENEYHNSNDLLHDLKRQGFNIDQLLEEVE
jgi:hypothetical protein